jgi:hypothetical protein
METTSPVFDLTTPSVRRLLNAASRVSGTPNGVPEIVQGLTDFELEGIEEMLEEIVADSEFSAVLVEDVATGINILTEHAEFVLEFIGAELMGREGS